MLDVPGTTVMKDPRSSTSSPLVGPQKHPVKACFYEMARTVLIPDQAFLAAKVGDSNKNEGG